MEKTMENNNSKQISKKKGNYQFPSDNISFYNFVQLLSSEYINGEFLNVDISKATSGSTGHTYLCRYYQKKFVLKWVKKDPAQNEIFCTEIMKKLGFFVPEITLIDDPKFNDLFNKFGRAFEKKMKGDINPLKIEIEEQIKDGKSTINNKMFQFHPFEYTKEYSVLYMPMIVAISLSQVFEGIIKIDEPSLKEFFKDFGKLAISDTFIGNNDRLFRFNITNSELSTINIGNIMVEIPFDENMQRKYKKLFAIDNTSYAKLDIDDFSLQFKSLKQGEQGANLLSDKILEGFKNEEKKPYFLESVQEIEIKEYLIEGIKQQIEILKKFDFTTFEDLFKEYDSKTNCVSAVTLIRKNIKTLKDQ